MKDSQHRPNSIRHKLHVIINEADTPMGRAFDLVLLVLIILSLLVVMLDSVDEISRSYGLLLQAIEWGITIAFTIEYLLRIYITSKPFKNYIFSFYGIVDFIAIVPSYASLFLGGLHFMLVIRVFRLIRVFRILKLARFVQAVNLLKTSLSDSRYIVVVFLELVSSVVLIVGALMYIIEGAESGFTSIPRGVYWAIVTLTTVGYGDIAPTTILGQFIASSLMILGYAIIAVPAGVLSNRVYKSQQKDKNLTLNTQMCEKCGCKSHDDDARYCKQCGTFLGE